MNRRSLLRGSVALGAAALAGCLGGGSDGGGSLTPIGGETDGGTPTATTTRNEGGVTSPPVPDKPAPLDRENVRAFARAYERMHAYDRIAFDGAEEVSVNCRAFLHRETGDGYVVLTGCGGSATGGGSHADMSGRPAFYYIDDERTVRVVDLRRIERPEEDAYAAEDSEENLDSAGGIRLYNFLDSSRTFAVEVTHLQTAETAYEADHELDASSGALVGNVARRRGSYAVAVASGDASATGGWTVSRNAAGGTTPTATLAPGPDMGVRLARIGEIAALGPV